MIKPFATVCLLTLMTTCVCQAQSVFHQPAARVGAAGSISSPQTANNFNASFFRSANAYNDGTAVGNGAWTEQEPSANFDLSGQQGSNSASGNTGASGGGSDAVKQSQNPIASLVSLPVQNNWEFGIGPEDRTRFTSIIQPVIPLQVNKRWNLITRPILPLINSPDGSVGRNHGLSDMQWQNFFVPVSDKPSKLTWGIGPSFVFPTASNPSLGNQLWGGGVSAVAVIADGPVVAGALVNQNFIETGVSQPCLLQPFYSYNFERGILKGSFITFSGDFQADWKKDSADRWNNVVGIGPGRGIKIFGQPMSVSTRFATNLDPGQNQGNWQFRLTATALFPK